MFIPLSPASPHYPDHAAPGRLRRLILTASGPLLLLVVPMVLVALYSERLPDRVYIQNWAVDTETAATWEGWVSQPLWGVVVWFEALFVVSFLRYWRLPQVQRVLVVGSSLIGVTVPVSGALWLLALVDAPGAVARPTWHLAVEITATAGALALGWVAAGPLPPPPVATATPPPHAPTMALGPVQRVMFVASAWSARRLLIAAVMAAVTAWTVSDGSSAWQGTALLALWTVFEAAQARTRLQIDGSGVTVRLPWLPALRRTVPYSMVRFADARSEAPPGRYKLDDGNAGWGVVSGKGPVLALSLSDDRWFVYSTREAETAAALVNGWLSRERQVGTA
ncbi:hypothetical protein SAMN05216276_10025 [Streptosporangium subroseum]|uniref:Uncharacterized protein n=1 Tax=Streptosporangium subroseum TaxID=106412 RepID=A0A239AMV7_9ACTN|nr:hypothetical protein [Streptosporangium subroseum]SNR96328.1 hypothetical protein SAMN05216276_10025 [Streptosporangium subroseum]